MSQNTLPRLNLPKIFNVLVEVCWLGGLFLLPFIFWPWWPIPFEVPRVFFVLRWVEVLAFLTIIGQCVLPINSKISKLTVLLLAVFLSITVVASVQGGDFTKSLYGNVYRVDGLITLFHCVMLAVLVSLYTSAAFLRKLSISIATSTWIVSIWSCLDFFRLHVLLQNVWHWPDGSVGVAFNQPNFLAGYLLVALPLNITMFSFAVKKWQKRVVGFFTFITFLAISFTYSFGSILGIVIFGVGFYLLFCGSPKNLKKKEVFLLLLICSFWCIFFSATAYQFQNNFIAESRERIFYKLWLAFQQRPLLGWGWANADHAFDSTTWPFLILQDVYVDKAHSQFLEILVTTGIIGFLSYFSLLVFSFLRLRQNRVLLLSFLLFIFHSQTNVISIAEEVLFWILVGISMSSFSTFSDKKKHPVKQGA